ncbi:toll/interleukin-1 receptor domain-containing protein [Saccharothrix sp. HUAS TT1]|uniref:toll/interleukin-1 receptor domain-containing protein n=1 Tax=unclassified Saccharothrix TaxID=2593673 RepID=UPI00345C3CA6
MGGIFVNYRTGDGDWAAVAIAKGLKSRFVEGDVFFASKSIDIGSPFVDRLNEALDRSEVLVAVIGPNWLARSSNGLRKIDNSEDWVRREIRFMLRAGRAILPVLLDGTTRLAANELPSDIAALAEIQFIRADKSTLDGAMDRLVAVLRTMLTVRPSPYRGLDAFTESDSDYFFGRSEETARLVERLNRQVFVAVEGGSGSGKSSLVRAGLVTALRQAGALVVVADSQDSRLESMLSETTWDGFDRVVVCVDQFEQLVASDLDAARTLFRLLTHHVRANPAVRVVITVRSSADLHNLPGSAELVENGGFLVQPMTAGQLAEAIREPALKAGRDVEPALVKRIIQDAGEQPSQLPLVEFMLTELWEAEPPGPLTTEGYDRLGGVEGALRQRAQEIYEQMPTPADARRFRQLFTRLARPRDDEGRGYILSPVRLDRLDSEMGKLALELSKSRLVVIRRGIGHADYVSIAHEALVRHWDQLAEWLAEAREFRSWQARLNANLDQWIDGGRDPGALLRGAPLAAAREKMSTDRDRLSVLEREYIQASADDARRVVRRSRRLVTVVALSLAAVLGIGVGGYFAATTAFDLRDMANSRKAAAAANSLRGQDAAAAARLSLAAYQVYPTPDALSGLLSASGTPSPTWTRLQQSDDIEAVAFGRDGTRLATGDVKGVVTLWDVSDFRAPRDPITLSRHSGAVRSVAFSGNGDLMATGGADGDLVLWDTSTDDVTAVDVIEVTGEVSSVALSLNGRFLLVGSSDHTATLWDLLLPHDARQLHRIDRHTGEIRVAFSPDGRTFVTAGVDRTVTVWRMDQFLNVREVDTFSPPAEGVLSMAFSPDGRLLGTGGADRRVALWRLDPPTKVGEVTDGQSWVSSIVFSPDREHLGTTNHDGSTRWWDVSDSTAPILLTVQGPFGSATTSAAIDRHGKVLVSAGGDATLRAWDATAFAPAHPDPVLSTELDHRGDTLASSGADKDVRLWDARDPRQLRLLSILEGHEDNVDVTLWSPDDSTLVTASLDGSIRSWDVTDRARPQLLDTVADAHGARGPHTGIVSAVLTTNGNALITGGFDGALKLWFVENGRVIAGRTLEQRDGRITKVALGHTTSRELLAVAGEDDVITLWDVANPHEVREVGRTPRQNEAIWAADFTPDGTMLATGGTSGQVRLWDVRDPAAPAVASSSTHDPAGIKSIKISQDSLMAVGTESGRIELVDIRDPAVSVGVATLVGHFGDVRTLEFTPDSHTLISGGKDRSVHAWELDGERAASRLCAELPPPPTETNWPSYIASMSYEKYC